MSGIDKNIGLDDLDFSVRTWKILKDGGVRTLGDLLDKNASDFWRMKHMGKKPMQEISDKLREFGVVMPGFEGIEGNSFATDEPKRFNGGNYWAEIRNDFFESENEINQMIDGDILAKISIDAWKTRDENEDGRVIACVMLSKHGDVLVDYRDNLARIDRAAQEAICDAKERLREYFQEKQKEAFVKDERATEQVYCLCEEFEDSDAIREFRILATSFDKDGLRKLMEAKISQDEYGFVKDKGVGEHGDDHFVTDFDCGFVEYYIRDQKVLSREELERLAQPSLEGLIAEADEQRVVQQELETRSEGLVSGTRSER